MIDRALQRRILAQLESLYPHGTDDLQQTLGEPHVDQDSLLANSLYLEAHGLVVSGFIRRDVIGSRSFIQAREHLITHRGIDFLKDDGGLSAILGVVTIRLHDETVKDLVAARITDSDLAPAEKKRWTDALRELPGETTKHLALKLVDLGLDQGQVAIAAIGKLIGMS